jgi:hypothetical protein
MNLSPRHDGRVAAFDAIQRIACNSSRASASFSCKGGLQSKLEPPPAGETILQLKHLCLAGALGLAALPASSALAAPCAGFSDVDDTVVGASFCQSVEWVKNRAVTLGCGAGTTYCPNDFVTRLQMAAFMNRLGTALTPQLLRKRDPGLGGQNFSAAKNLCATDPVTVTGYPRTAIVNGMLNAFTPDGGMDLKATVVYSTDGTTWIAPATNDGTAFGALYAGLTPPDDVTLRAVNFINLDVGTTYRFAIRGERVAGTGQNANAYCEVLVQLVNRNGASSPFDAAAADPGPHGRGD